MAALKFEGVPVADLWFRWLEVVRGIVEPNKTGSTISPQDYRNLHSALVRGCQDPNGSDASLSEKLQEVRRTVSPWVTYDSLKSADRRFLTDVLNQAGTISQTLKGHATGRAKRNRRGSRSRKGSLLLWIVAFGIGLGAGLYILMSNSPATVGLQYDLQQAMLRAKYKLQTYSFLQVFGTVTIVVLLIAGPLMYTTKKS